MKIIIRIRKVNICIL